MTQWKSKLLLASLTTGMLAVTAGYASADPRETGVWYDDSGKGAVRLSVCGNNLCGHIYWLKDPLNAEGKPLIDRHNPNEGQRTRPICGLQVIGGLAPMEGGEWDSGWIYDPKEGKSYSVAVALAGPDTLKVTGYLMMKMMGRTLTWKRAPDDLLVRHREHTLRRAVDAQDDAVRVEDEPLEGRVGEHAAQRLALAQRLGGLGQPQLVGQVVDDDGHQALPVGAGEGHAAHLRFERAPVPAAHADAAGEGPLRPARLVRGPGAPIAGHPEVHQRQAGQLVA